MANMKPDEQALTQHIMNDVGGALAGGWPISTMVMRYLTARNRRVIAEDLERFYLDKLIKESEGTYRHRD